MKRQKEIEHEDILRLYGGLFVIDKVHDIRNLRAGPWRFIGEMKDDTLNHRFWTVAMSGTMINSDPTDNFYQNSLENSGKIFATATIANSVSN